VRAFDHQDIRAYLFRCASAVERHQVYLTRLDAALGDGDHGDNLAMGFAAVAEMLTTDTSTRPGHLLRRAGYELTASVGGASGPLYGTAFIQAAETAGARPTIDADLLGEMLEAAALALARRGRCSVGDKTIQDTLRPAVDAYHAARSSGGEPAACLAAAIHAGARGMRSTRDLVARRGLALRLGDRAIGHLDPGAVSCLLLLRAMVAPERPSASRHNQHLAGVDA
jgi:dihydroxyacetone kinase-like protein